MVVNGSPFRLLCHPRDGQGDRHLHNGRVGALAAGLKIADHKFAGDLPGRVGHAAGGHDVNLFCGGQGQWGSLRCTGKPERTRRKERDGTAQR